MREVVEVVEVVKVLGPCCSPKVMVALIPRIQLNAHFVEIFMGHEASSNVN